MSVNDRAWINLPKTYTVEKGGFYHGIQQSKCTGTGKFTDEGAKLYSMGVHSFQELAKEANAVYHVKRIVLVNTEVIDAYLENFEDE